MTGRDATLARSLSDAPQLKQRVRRGAGATAVAQVAGQIIQIGVLAALYRLLPVDVFGLFYMVVPVVLVLRILSTLSLNIAAVQERELAEPRQSTIFWATTVAGVSTTALTAALAPLVAWWNNEPALVWVAVVLSGTTLLVALGSQHQALLERELRLSELAAARVAALVAGGASAVAAALAGLGVWSLVIQWYVEYGLLSVLCWWLAPWRPLFHFHLRDARGLLGFGGHYTAANLMFALAQNLDKLLLGRFAGVHELGLYSQAFNWMMKPVYLVTTPLASVMLPALARSAHDQTAFRDVLFAFTRLVGILLIPAGIGLAVVAPEAMLVIGGEQWREAGRLLRALAPAIVVQGFINAAGSVLAAVGRADRLLRCSMAMTIVLAIAYPLGYLIGRKFGQPVLGVAIAYTAGVMTLFAPYMVYALRVAGVSARAWLQLLWPLVWPSLAMGVVVVAVRSLLLSAAALPSLAQLLIEVLTGLGAYALLARRQLAWFFVQSRRMLGGK